MDISKFNIVVYSEFMLIKSLSLFSQISNLLDLKEYCYVRVLKVNTNNSQALIFPQRYTPKESSLFIKWRKTRYYQ